MTIADLKIMIENLPPDMKVGGTGYCGEYLECWDVNVRDVTKNRRSIEKETILSFAIEDAGEEPC